MSDFVNNPRRAPRSVIGCDARVALKSGAYFKGPTVDLGPAGCQVLSPSPVVPEERVFVEISNREVPESSLLSGRVAWAAGEEPYRAGVQFDLGSRDAAALYYGRLAAAHPDLVETDDVPDRVALDARVVPWKREGDAAVLPGEEAVLLAVGDGIRVRDLRDELGDRWEAAVNPLFALLARRLLVVEEGERTT
jgi:hypothetical protein